MLPAVDPETLSVNPKFDALYRDLCVNKLNTDGTTKIDAKAQKERDAFSEELRRKRIASAKSNLIKSYLHNITYRGDDLPSELQELVAIIAASLQTPLSKDDAGLLRDDIEKFKENIQLISLVVSHAAAQDITSLARIAASGEATHWKEIPSMISKTKKNIAADQVKLAALRVALAQEAGNVHALYREVMEVSIRILEQTIHGSVSRGTKAKADYLATVAEGMARKLQVQQNQLLAETRSPEMQQAVRNKIEALEREGVALKRKLREAEERLAEYQGARAIEGMAKEYAKILSETELVKEDIERLEGGRD